MQHLFVVIAIFPHNDADTVSVGLTKEAALAGWLDYMTAAGGDPNDPWLVANATNLELHGRTEYQDSKVFYRLNPMKAS